MIRLKRDDVDIEKLEYTFDRRKESEYNAARLYDIFINFPEGQDHPILSSKISFDTNANPRIQMADLVARETMKDMDNDVLGSPRPRRKSLVVVAQTGFIDFEHYGREWCESKRSQREELQRNAGITLADHKTWLRDLDRIDNWSNRLLYVAGLGEQESAN